MLPQKAAPVSAILKAFARQDGQKTVDAIKAHLGEDAIWPLSPLYALSKLRNPRFKRYPSKSTFQPLILSGSMYEGIQYTATGDGFTTSVAPGAGVDDQGGDYAEMWEQRVQYLELGLNDVEDQYETDLLDIIFTQLNL